MYNLPYFKERDEALVLHFIKKYPFGMLIGAAGNSPVATQLPFLVESREGRIFLSAHMMKGTDHYKAFLQNPDVLCMFTGPHCYVSARHYSNPQTASTWNYMSVHARGRLQFGDEGSLRALLEKQTAHFERDDASPASFHKLPPAYVDKLVPAIAGFEIEVQSLENVFKLSQNRDAESYDNIIHALRAGDTDERAIASEMELRREQLFSK
jgi:transcriptional regulator